MRYTTDSMHYRAATPQAMPRRGGVSGVWGGEGAAVERAARADFKGMDGPVLVSVVLPVTDNPISAYRAKKLALR